jgi:hypothetical protein
VSKPARLAARSSTHGWTRSDSTSATLASSRPSAGPSKPTSCCSGARSGPRARLKITTTTTITITITRRRRRRQAAIYDESEILELLPRALRCNLVQTLYQKQLCGVALFSRLGDGSLCGP